MISVYVGRQQEVFSEFFQKPSKIVVADAQQANFALIYIANELGYFKKRGLDVEYKHFKLGKDALAEVLNGQADMATVFDVPVVRAGFTNPETRILTTLHSSAQNTKLIVRKDSGIEEISHLAGRSIALSRGTSMEYFLFSLLYESGIPLTQINLIDAPSEKLIDKLKVKEVDGVVLWGQYRVQVQNDMAGGIVLFDNNSYQELSMLVTTQKQIENNSEAIQNFIDALVEAEKFAKGNREDAIAIVTKYVPNASEESITQLWEEMDVKLRLNNTLINLLEQEALWYKQNGILTGEIPRYRQLTAPQYLHKSSPEAVTIY